MSHDFQGTVFDLLVVGAGPAGMAAATVASRFGLSTIIVDENPAVGGQVYRNIGASPIPEVLGADYELGKSLVADLSSSEAVFVGQTTVWMVEKIPDDDHFSVGLLRAGVAEVWRARRVLLASGALERPFPIKGWTLPGVMTAGAAQTMLKQSAVVPSGRVVLAGTGPLLYLLAAQYARCGVPVAAMLDTTPSSNWFRAAAHIPGFLTSPLVRKGVGLLREVRGLTKIHRRVTAIRAEGTQHLQAVSFVSGGRDISIEADTLLLHQGVIPQVNLAMSAGCKHQWSSTRLAFEPVLDEAFRSSVMGISIAGDSSGIGGATAAEHTGRIAAMHIAGDLGKASSATIRQEASRVIRKLRKALAGRRFIEALYSPSDNFRMPANDVIVCRCEEVTASSLRDAARRGAHGPNQAKTFLRAGMGPCQGRLCGMTVTEILAKELSKHPDEIGHFNIRNPVKPITVGNLAGIKGDARSSRLF
jgi:NADPH-dependent 2,4-dienoyl-CoA reductase/sulfur reductase-like enzyme